MGAVAESLDLDSEEQAPEQGLSVAEVIDFARKWVIHYFKDKPYYCGGKIPHHLLVSRKRIDMVLDCTFKAAMDIADESLERTTDEEVVGDDTKTILAVLEDLNKHKVPQELSNGMFVLYLEFCLGADVAYA